MTILYFPPSERHPDREYYLDVLEHIFKRRKATAEIEVEV